MNVCEFRCLRFCKINSDLRGLAATPRYLVASMRQHRITEFSHHGIFANIILGSVSRAHKFVSCLLGCMCYNLVIQIVTGGGKTVIPLIILEYFHAHLSKEG